VRKEGSKEVFKVVSVLHPANESDYYYLYLVNQTVKTKITSITLKVVSHEIEVSHMNR
jgi:hypothetical protein